MKEMIHIRRFAKKKNSTVILDALNLAQEKHSNQFRKSGEPYIVHPLKVANHLLSLGIYNEKVIAVAILHDVKEDCILTSNEIMLLKKHKIDHYLNVLNKNNYRTTEEYYKALSEDIVTTLVKIADRCHNISTMLNAFTTEKIKNYIVETEKYVFPLCRKCKNNYPEYSNLIFVMKYHMESICNSIKGCMSLD